MNKTLALIIIVVVIFLGGAYFLFQEKPEDNKETTKETEVASKITEENYEEQSLKEETETLIVDVKYPKTNNDKIDQEIDALIQSKINEFKENIVAPINNGGPNGIYISYNTYLSSSHLLSIAFNFSTYPSGAAHPTTNTEVFNYSLAEEKRLSNNDLFKDNYLDVLSEICAEKLIEKIDLPDSTDLITEWIYRGSEPTEENYSNIVLTESGITVIFEQYQVAAYALGEQLVEISSSDISEILKD